MASIPFAAAASTISLTRPRPSSRLNSEWTCRCVKSFGARLVTEGPVYRRPPGYRGAMLPPGSDEVDFEAVIDDVLSRLPEPFQEQLGSVAIVVDEEATPDQLAAVRAHELFGLYEGVPRTRW